MLTTSKLCRELAVGVIYVGVVVNNYGHKLNEGHKDREIEHTTDQFEGMGELG